MIDHIRVNRLYDILVDMSNDIAKQVDRAKSNLNEDELSVLTDYLWQNDDSAILQTIAKTFL